MTRSTYAYVAYIRTVSSCLGWTLVKLHSSPFTTHPHTQQTNTMADNDVATRAPESDAQETSTVPAQPKAEAEAAPQSLFPGDTPAQTGPTMGVCRTQQR